MKSRLLGGFAACVFMFAVSATHAALVFTNTSNITLTASQVESGGNSSANPDVTGGNGGSLLAYTESGVFNCCGSNFLGNNLDDGDIGAGVPSDGSYAIPNAGDLTLTFDAGLSTLVGIAIYNGYGNRTDGNYTLRDDGGALLGAWNISNVSGASNSGVNSFWLSFNSPVSTSFLTLRASNIQNAGTPSYREIQVFGLTAVPVPAAAWLFGSGLIGLFGIAKHKKL